jgi:hypothetical protein
MSRLYKLKYFFSFSVFLIGGLLAFNLTFSHKASSLTGSNFNPGRIIDDIIFFNSGYMTVPDIQNFLNAKVPTCDTWGTQPISAGSSTTRAQWAAANGKPAPPYTCLKDYSQTVSAKAADSYCPGSISAGTKSAAQIIKEVGLACNVNPQALLVLLQKEQALITDDWPWPRQYEAATGFGCPDTAACDPDFAGFYNQVYYGARQYQRYAKQSQLFNYRAGTTSFVAYNPNSGCGGTNVFIQNQATAGLYNYTPYQPNAAALNNLYGTGDGCSAYGNRNFWRMFNDWFGSTYSDDTFGTHPDGALIAMNNRVYLVYNGTKRPVSTASVFLSYGYQWSEVKRATTGDYSLPDGIPLDVIHPGKLFRTPSSSVYTMVWDTSSNSWVKQMVTYDAFVNLGYRWDEVQVIPYAELPPGDYATPLSPARHPSETLIRAQNDSKVYMLDNGTRRYLPRPEVLYTYHYWWTDIKTATDQDNQLPIGPDYFYREGSVFFDGSNLYITDIPPTGDQTKRPIAPWECFSNRLGYSMSEAGFLPTDALPPTTGSIIYC